MRASLTQDIRQTILTEQDWPSVHEAGLTLLGFPAKECCGGLHCRYRGYEYKRKEKPRKTNKRDETRREKREGEDERIQIRYPGIGGQESGAWHSKVSHPSDRN